MYFVLLICLLAYIISHFVDPFWCFFLIDIVKIGLYSRFQGQEKPLLVFTFEKFKIGRCVTASVVDPLLQHVQYTECSGGETRQYNRAKSLTTCNTDSWIVPGQRSNW